MHILIIIKIHMPSFLVRLHNELVYFFQPSFSWLLSNDKNVED